MFAAGGLPISSMSRRGRRRSTAKPIYGRMFQTPFSDRIRNEAGLATMAVGNIYEPDHVNSILMAGRADLVCLGASASGGSLLDAACGSAELATVPRRGHCPISPGAISTGASLTDPNLPVRRYDGHSQRINATATVERTARLVTGGGTGVGAAIALSLAAAGDRVTISGRRAAPLQDRRRKTLRDHAADV